MQTALIYNRRPTARAFVLLLVFIGTVWLGSVSFGFLSVRNIATLILLCYVVLCGKHLNGQCFRLSGGLFLYYSYIAILGLFNPNFYNGFGETLVFARFLPSVVAILFFSNIINEMPVFMRFVKMLNLVVLFDAVVTILQGINNPIGWYIGQFFYNVDMGLEIEKSTLGISVANGIMGTPVENGYFLSSYGLLFFIPLFEEKKLFTTLVAIGNCWICAVALYFIQQRAAFYVFIIMMPIAMLLFNAKQKSKAIRVLFVIIVAISLLVFIRIMLRVDMGRLSSIEDSNRSDLKNAFMEFASKHLLFGDREEFVKLYGVTPHSFWMETFLFGGIGALLLYCVFLVKIIISVFRKMQMKNTLVLAVALSLLASIVVSYKHSSGIHSGYLLTVYPFILFMVVCNLSNNEGVSGV